MPAERSRWTAEMVRALPDDGKRYEVLDGELLVSPSPYRIKKRRVYQEERIPEYWIVDIEGSLVERWVPDESRPEILSDIISWQPRPDLNPLSLELPKFFRTVLTGVR